MELRDVKLFSDYCAIQESIVVDAVTQFADGNSGQCIHTCLSFLNGIPNLVDGLATLALAYFEKGDADVAFHLLHSAIVIRPEGFLYRNLGDMNFQLNRQPDAAKAYCKCVELEGAESHTGDAAFAMLELMQGNHLSACNYFRKHLHGVSKEGEATASDSWSEFLNYTQNIYKFVNANEKDKLVDLWEQGVGFSEIATSMGFRLPFVPADWQVRDAVISALCDEARSDDAYVIARKAMAESPDENIHNVLLRVMLSVSHDVRTEFFEESVRWGQEYARSASSEVKKFDFLSPVQFPGDIHIGFLCDYADTVFGEMVFFPMCELLSEQGFRVSLYSYNRVELDAGRFRFNIRNVLDKNVEALRSQIMTDGVNVLVDLNGRLRDDHRLAIFTHRTAPVQIMYMNLSGTSGIREFDFIIADDIRLPDENRKFFVEDVIRLPGNVVGALKLQRKVPVSESPCVSNGYVTFGSFNAFFKYNDPLFDAWARVLSGTPNSRILIKCLEAERPRVRKRIREAFSSRGIDSSRIMIEGGSNLVRMWERYATVDIALDTFPYNGGSTNKHAFWQGVPIITLMGNDWRCRVTAGLLNDVGLDELIATSEDEYVGKAVALALDMDRLACLRRNMPTYIERSRYFKPEVVFKELGEAVFRICQNLSQESTNN